jgi:glycosyltransferase involved in cell wall biosynthesis
MLLVYPPWVFDVPAEQQRVQLPNSEDARAVHSISVVIPTRNRPASLARTLAALRAQTRPPQELIVVDASDAPPDPDVLRASVPCPVVCLHTAAGVCAQRNLGIQRARGSHVLLCDDDIEPPAEYLHQLVAHLDAHPAAGAVTGLVCEPDHDGQFIGAAQAPSFRYLFFAFLFQHSVWADVESASAHWPVALLKRWYRSRGNTWSLAGWPLFTQLRAPVVHTATYGLGAALIRRDWLLASPYDERLGPHGIGDNYGVALGFPGSGGIDVLVDLPVRHHRVAENRLDPADVHFLRVLALDYFTRTSARFPRSTTRWLVWSLLGKAIVFLFGRQRDMMRSNAQALATVFRSRNALLAGQLARTRRGR